MSQDNNSLLSRIRNISLLKTSAIGVGAIAAYPAIPLAAGIAATSKIRKSERLSSKAKNTATAGILSLTTAFSAGLAHTGPYWNYVTGVNRDVCRITEKAEKAFAVQPALFGLTTRYSEEYAVGDQVHDMYVIGTENVEGHENSDCRTKYVKDTDWYFNTRSSDLQSDLKVGEIYRLRSVGWDRNYFTGRLGWAPNIVRFEPYEPEESTPDLPEPGQ
ncbi:MAG: hypothetical protein ACLFR0_02490 [Alphaproteobacteria bacterium]